MWLLIVVLTWIVEWLVLVYPRRDKRTDIFYRLRWGGRRILAVTIKFTWSPLRLCSIIMTPLPPLPLSLRSIFYKPHFEDWSPLHSPENHVIPLAKKLLGTSPRPLPGPPLPPQAIDIEWSQSPIKMRRLWNRVWYEYKREQMDWICGLKRGETWMQ